MRRLGLLGPGVAALVAAAPAQAAVNGPIAFERPGALFTLTAPGAPATAIGQGRREHDPAVSPDGGRIAFIRHRDVWVMARDGSGARPLTTDRRFNEHPAWTPDGRQVVYATSAHGRKELAAVAVAGGPTRRLTFTPDNEERHPTVSPDGTRIAYERTGCERPRGGGSCVYVMPAAGGEGVDLTPEERLPGCEDRPGFGFHGFSGQPAWSPDGRRIAFVGSTLCSVGPRGKDIWTMGADGSGKLNLTRDDGTDDAAPAWSPDGTTLLYTRDAATTMAIGAGGGASVPLLAGINASWGVAACVVPELAGDTIARAGRRLAAAGCRVGRVVRRASGGRPGRVVAQAVRAGTRRDAGAAVALTVRR